MEEDKNLSERELFEICFKRAQKSKKLVQLWDATEESHNDGKYSYNPFIK